MYSVVRTTPLVSWSVVPRAHLSVCAVYHCVRGQSTSRAVSACHRDHQIWERYLEGDREGFRAERRTGQGGRPEYSGIGDGRLLLDVGFRLELGTGEP